MKLSVCTLAALFVLSLVRAEETASTTTAPIQHIDIDAVPKAAPSDTFEYQAQTSRLMNLIVHSMYVNKEVFIRELLANACDAIDKLKRKAFGDAKLTEEVTQGSRVVVSVDAKAGTITFADNGIGMSRAELKEYLGTIAKSGTSELLTKLKESKDASSLIGQFGVGFYSVFLVGDRVAVASKSDEDDKQWVWRSEADSGAFSIVEDPRGKTMTRGTEITIKLKAEEARFLDEAEVRKHMQTYATYFPYPIYLQEHREKEVPVEAADDAPKVEDSDEASKKKETKTVTVVEDYHVNSQKPLWMRDSKTVSKEEYTQMYQTVFKTKEEPLAYIQFAVEGDVSYKGVLFVPKQAPFEVYTLKDARPDIHLYVRRSFVTDKVEDILPATLAFVKGVVDSDDLPLNISRETLQNTVALRSIKAKVASKAIEMFRNVLEGEDAAAAKAFWSQYASHIKLEVARRENLRAKLAPLLRFETSESKGALVSLDAYVERRKKANADAKNILYLSGASKREVAQSPFMEGPRKASLEVIYATDPVDEQTLKALAKYHEMTFQSIAQDGFKLNENDKEDDKETKAAREVEFKPLVEWLKKTALPSDIEKVVLSDKLVRSPFAVVANQFGLTGHVERLYLQQQQANAAGGKPDPMMSFFTSQRKILEVNPTHPTIQLLLKAVSGEDAKIKEEQLKTITRALYDSALLSSGFVIHKTERFGEAIERMAFSVLGEAYTPPPPKTAEEEAFEEPEDPIAKMMREMADREPAEGENAANEENVVETTVDVNADSVEAESADAESAARDEL